MVKTPHVYLVITFCLYLLVIASCGSAISSAGSALAEECANVHTDEFNTDLVEECKELAAELENSQNDLANKMEVLSIRTVGSNSDIALLITDHNGDPVTDLSQSDIAVEGSTNSGSTFSSIPTTGITSYESLATSEPGHNHISFASVIDYSASIFDEELLDVTNALDYLYNTLDRIYRSEVVKFSSTVEVTQPFTNNNASLVAAINDTSFERGYTRMYDGLLRALEDTAAESSSLKFIVLFTDGIDNAFNTNYETVKTYFQAQDIPVCVVGVSLADINLLQQIASDSGCFFIYKPSFADLTEAYEMVVTQIENFYRIRISSANLSGIDTIRVTADTVSGPRQVTSPL